MTKNEQDLLILIADMVYPIFVTNEARNCAVTGQEDEYFETVNSAGAILDQLKQALGVPGYSVEEIGCLQEPPNKKQ